MQQAQLQQLIIRSRQQTQQTNQRTSPATGSPIRRITLTNLNIPNAGGATNPANNNNNDNNNNQNILVTFGTYVRQNVRLLNVFRTIRNVLWSGIINPNLNNTNTPRIRMINLRNNLRQINLGGIEIRPSSNATGSANGNATTADTRSTFQRNYDENNFRVAADAENATEATDSPMTNSGSTQNDESLNSTTDASTESDNDKKMESIETETQTAGTKEMNDESIDEYSFEIIENKQNRNEFDEPNESVTPSAESGTTITTVGDGDNNAATTANTITTTETAATTTSPPEHTPIIVSQSNEKSNQTILLEKMEIREDNSRDDNDVDDDDEQKTYENLFTESSSEEICSSNKGDTGNCNVECRGNEFVEGDEVERNSRQNDRVTDGNGIGETNCDLNCKSKIN